MAKSKPRVIKNFEKLDEALREQITALYPNGFATAIQTFDIGGGRFMSALPFETEEYNYLIKFPIKEPDPIEEIDLNVDEIDIDDKEDDGEDGDDKIETSMGNLEDLEVADEN